MPPQSVSYVGPFHSKYYDSPAGQRGLCTRARARDCLIRKHQGCACSTGGGGWSGGRGQQFSLCLLLCSVKHDNLEYRINDCLPMLPTHASNKPPLYQLLRRWESQNLHFKSERRLLRRQVMVLYQLISFFNGKAVRAAREDSFCHGTAVVNALFRVVDMCECASACALYGHEK